MKNHNPYKQHLGVKLKAEMDRLKLKPPAVAKAFGVAVPSVYDWINEGRIAKRHYGKLVEVFGRPLEWWFEMGTMGGAIVARDSAGQAHLRPDEAELLELYNFMTEVDRQALLASLGEKRNTFMVMFDEIMRRRQSSTVKS